MSDISQATLGDLEPDLRCPTCGRTDFKNKLGLKQHHSHAHGELLQKTDLNCENCGKKFSVRSSNSEERRFCSRSCAGEWRKNRDEIECENCGKQFSVRTSLSEKRRFCSEECAHEGHKNRVEIECRHCEDLFEVPKHVSNDRRFCSNSCSAKAQNHLTTNPASFTLEGQYGYPRWNHPKNTSVHQLIAVANGADPHKVYGNYRYSVDHKNGCKLDNRHENIRLMDNTEHGKKDKQRQLDMGYTHSDVLAVVEFFMNPSEHITD